MSLPFFYSADCASSQIITLDADTSRHVGQVLRMKPGDQLQLTDGRGNLVIASVISPDKHGCSVSVIAGELVDPHPARITVAVSLLKQIARFEWFLEKATELGVDDIIPLKCARTEKQQFRTERLQNILSSAMIQSRQAWLPVLHEPTALQDVLQSAKQKNKWLAHCYPGQKQELPERQSGDAIILIGPEGDFTEQEVQSALAAGFMPVSLGTNRLRTETAAMASAVLLCAGR